MDFLLAGKAMSWNTGQEARVKYKVGMKTIDSKITPQNRVIVCQSCVANSQIYATDKAHAKLQQAYRKAHKLHDKTNDISKIPWLRPSLYALGGFISGAATSVVLIHSKNKTGLS